MIEHVKNSLADAQSALNRFLQDERSLQDIVAAADLLTYAFRTSGKAFSCGNGGSMCDAMHFAEEFTGRFRNNRQGVAAIAISDPTHITCVANDYGYDQVFSRYIQAHGRPGDVLLAISTSGKSRSILVAAEAARELGLRVIGLTGSPESPLQALCDVCICSPGGAYADRVQEMHIKIIHILLELVERDLFPENYMSEKGGL
ncbi:SIS domain-containing protein [Massilia sp. YIM B02763]|uniref:SIS domain-containing protein n=1 Tax=Massilia sp. YIM B02763 TaxID=3050130 RepID=UPI0025B70BD8|nr:SIS domain-containing protein [Massilia sp. YIM B02763]MDN4053148.1 SIS domain-containing protein [Massilia sp. YIM B02763]